MLCDKYSFIKENKVVKLLNSFIYSPYYMLAAALLMAASNVFSLEFPVIYIYTLTVIYVSLFAPDCFGYLPLFCCAYMLFSARNNPAANYGENFLSSTAGKVQFGVVLAVIAIAVLSRFVYELTVNKRYKSVGKLQLTYGYIALGVAYIISGLFSSGYSMRTVIFGAVEIISLCTTYYFFAYTVDWSKRSGIDFAFLFTAVGVGIFLEIVGMYCTPRVIDAINNGTMTRYMLLSGWGVYNNVGGMMAMMIPAPFFLAIKHKFRSFWILLGVLFTAGVILTQSRSAIIVAAVIFVVCVIAMIKYSDASARKYYIYGCAGCLAIFAVAAIFLYKPLLTKILTISGPSGFFDDSGRFGIYKTGIEKFFEAPIFGNGFYVSEGIVYQYGSENLPTGAFLPPRFHNTYVQLLASGGIVAMIAYAYHRVETALMIIRKKTEYSVFAALSIIVLLLASLLDCHFFNFGPGIFYGILLISIEKISESKT